MMRTRAGQPRTAFTAIELLVVVTIIALLAALLVGAASKVLALQARTEAASDITRMQQSLETAKAAYNNIEYLPSKLVLINNIDVYRDPSKPAYGLSPSQQYEVKRTANVLRKMFGRRFITNGSTVNWGVAAAGTANGQPLTGSECLVFYLGGIPDTANRRCRGFSNDPLNPTASGGERIGPFYDFKTTRLTAGPSSTYFQYLDPWGTPYAYFGAYSSNNYDASHAEAFSTKEGSTTVGPYGSSSNWINPKTYQIISAGRNLRFGPGAANWNASSGYGDIVDGADDLSNFSSTELRDPQS